MSEQAISFSPTPRRKEQTFTTQQMQMDFPDALRYVILGKKITKLEWNNPESYGYLDNGRLVLHLPDGLHLWIVSDGDLIGQDWVVV